MFELDNCLSNLKDVPELHGRECDIGMVDCTMHRDYNNTKSKCRIGREWANLAGANYRYYMVFRDKDLKWDGAVRFDGMIEIVMEL